MIDPRQVTRLAVIGATALAAIGGSTPTSQLSPEGTQRVIVMADSGELLSVQTAIEEMGGTVDRELESIDGFAATVPTDSLDMLDSSASVTDVILDPEIEVQQPTITDSEAPVGIAPPTMDSPTVSGPPVFVQTLRAHEAWARGLRGSTRINVAVLDSGIAPVKDLTEPQNRIVGWVDLVDRSRTPIDPHGHGTFVAGAIAGNGLSSKGRWSGVAPEVGLIGVRVLNRLGVGSASTIIDGIEWAIKNRDRYDIRVLNLSFSTNSDLGYAVDAVTTAAEQAWRAGIVVVASAGNQGPLPGTILSPGIDPWLITVGATDDRGTASVMDDHVAPWSGRGPTAIDRNAKPDVVAPGTWITGLRVPGSFVDLQHPLSVRDEHYFDGSGTSPSAGLVSGVVALMLQAKPDLTPDRVKASLMSTASAMGDGRFAAGAGTVDAVAAIRHRSNDRANAGLAPARGRGRLATVGIPDVKMR